MPDNAQSSENHPAQTGLTDNAVVRLVNDKEDQQVAEGVTTELKLPDEVLKGPNVDTNPYKEIKGKDGRRLWVRTIESRILEYVTAKDFRWQELLRSTDATDKRMMNEDQKTLKVMRPGNAITKFAYKVLMLPKHGSDRWSADLITWKAIMELSAQYPHDHDRRDTDSPETERGRENKKEPSFWKSWYDVRHEQGIKDGEVDVKEDTGEDDVMLFSVFDGHSGNETAHLLKAVFHGCLSYTLGQARSPTDDEVMSPERMVEAIEKSFKAIDDDLAYGPLRLLSPGIPYQPSTFLPPEPPSQFVGSNGIYSGSCALTMLYDARAQRIYVANCGDSRAVAGWWDHKNLRWRCDILTEDHNGDNPKERERVRNEHPEREREHMFEASPQMRFFGDIHPTRAFGDHAFKWKYDDWVEFWRTVKQERPRMRQSSSQQELRQTPPYVTAEPEVVWRDLKADENEELKFVVLATDGLWGRMSSEEAFVLTATTYNKSQFRNSKNLDKKQIIDKFFPMLQDLSTEDHPFPLEELDKEGKWDLRPDDSAPVRLVRNAHGGYDVQTRRKLLSVEHNPKYIRDDTTVLVAHFGSDTLLKAKSSNSKEAPQGPKSTGGV